MKRRDLLSGLGTVGALSLAGCLGGAGSNGVETPPSDTPTSGTPTPTTSTPPPTTSAVPTEMPGPVETTFAVGKRSCGSGEDDASVSFADDAVEISGTIGGRDTCDTAELARVHASDDTLTVRVRTVREEGTDTLACAQCLTDIEYAVTIRFEGVLPGTIEVIHESRNGIVTAARAER